MKELKKTIGGKKMKKKYIGPSIQVEAFETEDIIATSGVVVSLIKDDEKEVTDQVVEGFFDD
jgi:hypothetical protein